LPGSTVGQKVLLASSAAAVAAALRRAAKGRRRARIFVRAFEVADLEAAFSGVGTQIGDATAGLRGEAVEAASKFLGSLRSASMASPELQEVLKSQSQAFQSASAILQDLLHLIPKEVVDFMTNEAMAPAAGPSAIGAVVVAWLAFRRGPQPWLDELPSGYDPEWTTAYWSRRPFRLLQKFALVGVSGGGFWLQQKLDKVFQVEEQNMPQRAEQARELVTDLGVSFIKIAQLWASRPDILPEPYIKEFEKLLEQVRPFGRDQAFVTLRRNFGDELESVFDDMKAFDKPLASASVGQVYKATIKGRTVAVKVQRPDVREQVALDLYVIRALCKLGLMLPDERIRRQCQSSLELIALTAPTWFQELDYKAEAANQRKFAEMTKDCDLITNTIVVPEVVISKPEVLVQQWLDGKKLSELRGNQEQSAKVVNLLLNSYMVQFLETGYLHGDPHPGNFILMPTGQLGILDYGLMTTINPDKRVAFIEYLMHLQAKDYSKCLADLINLEFIPRAVGDDPQARDVLIPALTQTLSTLYTGGDMRKKQEIFSQQREEMKNTGKLDILRSQLQDIAKKYGTFQLPAYFTLILRSFSTLEGLGLRMNENFNIVQECFPYIARRLLTDDSSRIREALKSYLYQGRKRIAIKRIDDLTSGFSTFTNLMKSEKTGEVTIVAGSMAPSTPATISTGSSTPPAAPQAQASQKAEINNALQDITKASQKAEINNALQDITKASQKAEINNALQDITKASEKAEINNALQDITKVVFSPEGNYLQDILIEEGIAAVDALSRASLVQLVRVLGPFALPITLPLSLIFGSSEAEHLILNREDKEALLLLRRIVDLVQGSSQGSSSSEVTARRAAQDLQRLQPIAQGLLPTVAPGAASFARRFSQQLARRFLLRLAGDIEKSAGLGATARRLVGAA